MKFKPLDDLLVVELCNKYQNVVLLEGAAAPEGSTFKVVDIGPGLRNEFTGERIPMDIQIGDEIYLVGKILDIPYGDGKISIGRSKDVIGYIRKEKDGSTITN